MFKILKPLTLILWTIGCYFGFRWTLYKYWAFDIINPASWQELGYLWETGKVFPWLFICAFIIIVPVWIMGIIGIRKTNIEVAVKKTLTFPFAMNKRKKIQSLAKKSVKIKKKKSYVNTRPPALKPVMGEAFAVNPRKHIEATDGKYSPSIDEDDNDDFYSSRDDRRSNNFDDYSDDRLPILGEPEDSDLEFLDPTIKQKSFDNHGKNYDEAETSANIKEIIENAGYEAITKVKAGKDVIDFVAISNSAIILCFEETQKGNWLADEERFNDDEPLWFSESAQKVSPAYKALEIRNKVNDAISIVLPEVMVVPVLIISQGTIINAPDMLDTWEEMQVFVSRIGAGGPNDLKKLNNLIPQNQDDNTNEEIVEKIKSAIKSIK